MFTFIIRESKAEAEIIVTRILLAGAGVVVLTQPLQQYFYLNVVCSIIFFFASYFVKKIVAKVKAGQLLLLSLSAIILYIVTHSFFYPTILVVYGILLQFFRKKASIEISVNGIKIKKIFADQTESWSSFSNIILKDGLLTLDFTNNKLLQLPIEENSTIVNEDQFNEFCRNQLGVNNN